MGPRSRMSSEDLPIPRPPYTANLPQEDQILVDEVALESFPASDPPAWTATHAGDRSVEAPRIETPRELRAKLRTDVDRLVALSGDGDVREVQRLQAAAELVTTELLEAGRHVVRIPVANRPGVDTMEAVIRGAAGGPGLVIGARYDTNPSAVAVLLGLAELLSNRRFTNTVRLVAYAGDTGAPEYAKRLHREAIDVRGMLSLHSVGFLTDRDLGGSLTGGVKRLLPTWRGRFVAFVGDARSRDLRAEACRAFSDATRLEARAYALPSLFPLVASSDHRPFAREGFPASLVTDTGPFQNRRQPRMSDLPTMLNYDAMADLVFGLSSVVTRLAGDEYA